MNGDFMLLAQDGAEALVAIFMMLIFGCSMLFSFAALGFVIWMLVDCLQNETKMPNDQTLIWVLVIILAGVIGAAIYYFVRRPQNRYSPPALPPHGPTK